MVKKKLTLKQTLKNKFIKLIDDINFQRFLILTLTNVIILITIPFYFFLDSKAYDIFITSFKKPIIQDDSLMLLDIDDNVMNSLPYSWPIPRNFHGDAVEILADFGAKAVIYDIEFLEQSIVGVNPAVQNTVMENVADNFQNILNDIDTEINRVAANPGLRYRIPDIMDTFNEKLSDYYRTIDEQVNDMVIDYDQYFADRLHYFGKAFGTVNMLDVIDPEKTDTQNPNPKNNPQKVKEFLEKYGIKKELILKKKKNHPAIVNVNTAEFTTEKLMNQMVNIGFTKVERDKDGATRGINLFLEKDGYLIPQLAFRPFLSLYQITPEQIDLSNNQFVILRDVKISDKKAVTIRIPIVNHMMKINWPSGKFLQIFAYNKKLVKSGKEPPQHYSYKNLLNYKNVLLKQLEDDLAKNLDQFAYDENAQMFYNKYQAIKKAKEDIIQNEMLSDDLRTQLNEAFDSYFNELYEFASEENIKKKEKEIDENKKNTNQTDEYWENQKNEIRKIMESIQEDIRIVQKARSDLKILEGKICFVGLTATGTTDKSPQPFDKQFENVGIHPSIYNTILQRNFIYIVPIWLILLFTLIVFGSIIWMLSKQSSIMIALVGIISTLVVITGIALFYHFTNIFISPVIPFLFGIISFIIMVVIKFIHAELQKHSIRQAFDKYLSPDYIDELLKDKSKLELDGIRRNCTAIFTDIQGFSSISEKFMDDPKGLVNLLKDYLSAMSDIILENKGTIDKYEGDAIIAFFGAPKEMSDHAFRACLSSIQMKQIEKDLNEKIMKNKILDKPLLTRIGVNTGEMFVGNMGTTNKLNYTIMGHAVNLAARLEGVNKQYSTYQLVSEYTYQDIRDKIVTRKLDRVRVVNIQTPIRLYELICLTEELKPELKELLDLFDRGLTEFEKQNWQEAQKLFDLVLSGNPEDGPAKIYIDRLKKIKKSPPPANWDGVYNLTSK